ncbi:MAG: hypothetical protein IGR93_20665 [Hydrococcus sp. C42_A2020_068]|nr:hypothetical protein [Hydrococcus sp. C42_A2020_068]
MVAPRFEIQYAAYRDWQPQDYLAQYYVDVKTEELLTLEFLVQSLQNMPTTSVMLDFGCGPIISHILPMVPKVQEIHMAEYLPANRAEVQKWLASTDDAHNWRAFALATLRLEGNPNPTETEAKAREQQARDRIKSLLPCDVNKPDPLGAQRRGFYPLVTTSYCAEGVTTSKEKWRAYIRNIASLVKPGGVLLLSAVGGAANFYRVGDRYFPCTRLDRQDVLASLGENGFTDIDIRIRQVSDRSQEDYSHLIFARAVKAG